MALAGIEWEGVKDPLIAVSWMTKFAAAGRINLSSQLKVDSCHQDGPRERSFLELGSGRRES